MPVISHHNFIEQIEEIVFKNRITYIDAIIHWCEFNQFDVEYAGDLIRKNPTLKSRIQKEAISLNFLKPEEEKESDII